MNNETYNMYYRLDGNSHNNVVVLTHGIPTSSVSIVSSFVSNVDSIESSLAFASPSLEFVEPTFLIN